MTLFLRMWRIKISDNYTNLVFGIGEKYNTPRKKLLIHFLLDVYGIVRQKGANRE